MWKVAHKFIAEFCGFLTIWCNPIASRVLLDVVWLSSSSHIKFLQMTVYWRHRLICFATANRKRPMSHTQLRARTSKCSHSKCEVLWISLSAFFPRGFEVKVTVLSFGVKVRPLKMWFCTVHSAHYVNEITSLQVFGRHLITQIYK